MSVTTSDIKIYASANMPRGNTTTSGGAINSGTRVVFTDMSTTTWIWASGTTSNETGTLTLRGRNAAGQIISENIQITGTATKKSTNQYERILEMYYTKAAHSGNINIKESGTWTLLAQMEPRVTGIRRPFYDATADAPGGAQRVFYEKVFVRNNNNTNALLSAQVTEVSSGLFAKVQFGLENKLNAQWSIPARTGATTPSGVPFYGAGASGIPNGGDLPAAQHQGMWLQLTLAAGDAATNSFYQFKVTGNTT